MKRILTPILALGFVTGVAVLLSHRPPPHGSPTPDAPRILAAVQSYTAACQAEGRPVPKSIPLQELVDRGHLTTGDLGPFAGLDVRIYPGANETRPHDRLMEARLPDGGVVVALADGSVQSPRPR